MEIKILKYSTTGRPLTFDFYAYDAADAAATLIENYTSDHEGIALLQQLDFLEHLQNLIDLAKEAGGCEFYIKKLECQKVLASQQPAQCYFITTPHGAWLYTTPELALRSSELASIANIRGLAINDKQIYHFAKAKHCKVGEFDFEL